MIIGVSGHRRLAQEPGELKQFARLSVARMIRAGATEIITGMALGWDLAVARAADDLGIPFCAAIPFPQQAADWSPDEQDGWTELVARAARRDIGFPYPTTAALHRRSYWVVDNCAELWTLFDGRPSGTGKCVLYAEQQGRKVVPLWDQWILHRATKG